MRPLARRAACLAVLLLAAAPVRAQEYVGPTKCFGCHKLGKKVWQDGHAQTLAQLSEPKAAEYAKATGGDAKHPKCLACHAPVPLATGPAPVSCETCHGPGKGWLVPHQELAFYSQPPAQWKGLRDLHKNSKEIARICVECHVLNDKAIAAAGHPVGATFDVGREIAGVKMVHWPSGTVNDTRVRGYDKTFYAAISREGAPIVASRSAGVGGKAVAGKPAAQPPGARSAVTVGGSAMPRPGGAGGPERPPASNDEYADLGDDEFVQGASVAVPPATTANRVPAPVKPRPIERLALPDAPTAEFEKPPVRVVPRPPPPPPPASTRAAEAPPPPPPPPRPQGAAAVRGRAALVLTDLIRQKKKLDLPPPAPPAEFAGPDGELLRLQDEVLALALETLRRVP